jgi:hypothetical protein
MTLRELNSLLQKHGATVLRTADADTYTMWVHDSISDTYGRQEFETGTPPATVTWMAERAMFDVSRKGIDQGRHPCIRVSEN